MDSMPTVLDGNSIERQRPSVSFNFEKALEKV